MPEITDQPAPERNDRPHIADLVMVDMAERKKVDAYQEALDLMMHLRQAIEERRAGA